MNYQQKGKIGLVLVNGAFSTHTSSEKEIRKSIIEDDLLHCLRNFSIALLFLLLCVLSRQEKTDRTGRTVIDAPHMVNRKQRDFSD